MEKTLSVQDIDLLQRLIDKDAFDVDESYHIGTVTFDDGTAMEVMLYGTVDGTFLQGVVYGLGNDEIDWCGDSLDVEGYRVRLI